VTLLQTKLIQRGFDCGRYGADGIFGAATESAVKAFQTSAGVDPDGVVGEKTWDALEEDLPLYTVTVLHLSKTVANEIVSKYGGTMTLEGR
jgi:peptidoglycan hydrolase-like protein with peptidoglycan-binding domain